MRERFTKSFALTGCLALVVTVLTACATCKPGRPGPVGKHSVVLTLDESLKSSSVVVDLVGVNPSSQARWEAYDMGKYWREGDPMRRDADKVVLDFVSGQALTRTLPITDAQWEKWAAKGVTQLLVLADLPGAQTSRPGNQDARRQILPLDKCYWPDKTTELKVLVQRSGIAVQTPVRPFK
jgi:hypothetical protein